MWKKIKKTFLISLLIITFSAGGMVTDADAANITLKDISGHWGEQYIQTLVDRNIISGYGDGSFKPNNFISNAEFITILMRSLVGDQTWTTDTQIWYNGAVGESLARGVLQQGDIKDADFNKPLSRYMMAQLMDRSTQRILGESKVITDGAEQRISDYATIAKTPYKEAVKQMFMKGLLVGDSKGAFNGSKGVTRAEAATVICKLIGLSPRVEISKIYDLNDQNRAPAKAGDKVVVNGVEYTLTFTSLINSLGDRRINVLGMGVPVATEMGRRSSDGYVIKHGILGDAASGFKGQVYIVWTTKGTGEGHYRDEWEAIKYNTRPATSGTEQSEILNTYWEWTKNGWDFLPFHNLTNLH